MNNEIKNLVANWNEAAFKAACAMIEECYVEECDEECDDEEEDEPCCG